MCVAYFELHMRGARQRQGDGVGERGSEVWRVAGCIFNIFTTHGASGLRCLRLLSKNVNVPVGT